MATHRNKAAAQALREHGCWFLFLPPYSPDLNPIEMAFSKLKVHLRKAGVRTFTDMFEATGSICDLYAHSDNIRALITILSAHPFADLFWRPFDVYWV